jgi:SWI/SNF-related matrix-associated actin-dependent regulator of chromatin subfamily A member 5
VFFFQGEAPQSGMIGKFVVLPPELQDEKTRLLTEGFGDWTRMHFNNFVRASAKHGRNEFEKIAKEVGRPLEETKKYAATFWERGFSELPHTEWDRVTKQIEKVFFLLLFKRILFTGFHHRAKKGLRKLAD